MARNNAIGLKKDRLPTALNAVTMVATTMARQTDRVRVTMMRIRTIRNPNMDTSRQRPWSQKNPLNKNGMNRKRAEA